MEYDNFMYVRKGDKMPQLLDIIKTRRSIRTFKDKKIPRLILKKLIEAAIWAPSACNMQDWRFIIIDDYDIKKEIYDNGGAVTIKDSPVTLVICYDNRTDNKEYGDYIQSTAAAIQNMLLYAHELGLGSCWINHLPNKNVLRKILFIPKNYDPVGAIILGYPVDKQKTVPRRHKLENYYYYNKFYFKINPTKTWKKSLSRRFAKNIYYLLPKWVKIKLHNRIKPFITDK